MTKTLEEMKTLAAKQAKLLAEIVTGGPLTADQVTRANQLVTESMRADLNVLPLAA